LKCGTAAPITCAEAMANAIRSADGGGATITVCEDQTGTTESVRVAADWVRTKRAPMRSELLRR
jgi:hypothetical protein